MDNRALIGVEQRRHKRVDAEVRVSYRLATLKDMATDVAGLQGGEPGVWHGGLTRNVSVGGVFLAGREPLQPGQVLQLTLDLPSGLGRVAAWAEVVWSRPVEGLADAWHNGIRFLAVKDRDMSALSGFIQGLAQSGQNQPT